MSRKNVSNFKFFASTKESQTSLYEQIPFFPKYETHLNCKEQLRVTWFENLFSQSKYSYEKNNVKGSKACTLIVILVAAKCYFNKINIEGPERPIQCKLIYALAYGMLLGNSIHDLLKTNSVLSNDYLTVPEAVKYAGDRALGIREWKSELHYQPLALTLYTNLKRLWREWHCYCVIRCKMQDLYAVLISDSRSVIFIFQERFDTVTLIDSHLHSSHKGAFVATVYRTNLKILCNWFGHLMYKCYDSYPTLYELSLLYYKNKVTHQKGNYRAPVRILKK